MKKTHIAVAVASGILLMAGCTAKSNTSGYSNARTQDQAEARKNTARNQEQTAVQQQENTPVAKMDKDIALSVISPQTNTTVTTASITVKGTTVPNAEVYVNDVELRADTKGEFSTPITLYDGENTISVAANDTNGNASEEELTVTYDAQ